MPLLSHHSRGPTPPYTNLSNNIQLMYPPFIYLIFIIFYYMFKCYHVIYYINCFKMSKLNICNTGTIGRSMLSTEVVPLYKERINQIKIKSNHNVDFCSSTHYNCPSDSPRVLWTCPAALL